MYEQVRLDKANFELETLGAKLADMQKTINSNQQQIKEVRQEMELHADPPLGKNGTVDETPEDQQIRLELLDTLNQEVIKKEMEISITEQLREATATMEGMK